MTFRTSKYGLFSFFVVAYALMFMGTSGYDTTWVYGKWIRSPITHDMTFEGTITAEDDVTFGTEVVFNTTATFDAEYDNGNSGTSKTIDWGNGNKQKITLTGNCTFTFTAPDTGVGNFLIRLIQDGTGSRTVTWPASVKWPADTAPTLTTTAAAIDIVSLYWTGVRYESSAGLDFR